MINIIFALLKYNRSKSSFLTFCAGYRWHYACNDVIIWFAYKWSKMLTKKLARGLKRFSIFQLTRFHQKISVFTKCPRDPQKWTIAPALVPPGRVFSRNTHPAAIYLSQDIMILHWCQLNDRHILLIYKKCHFHHLLLFVKVGQLLQQKADSNREPLR